MVCGSVASHSRFCFERWLPCAVQVEQQQRLIAQNFKPTPRAIGKESRQQAQQNFAGRGASSLPQPIIAYASSLSTLNAFCGRYNVEVEEQEEMQDGGWICQMR